MSDLQLITSTTDDQNKYVRTTVKLRITKGLLTELEKIAIPDSIKNEANRIFIENKISARKGDKLKHALFYCVYNAMKNLGLAPIPKKVANLVGLPHGEISKASSMFSGTNNTSFINQIPQLCEDLGITDTITIDSIKSLGQRLLRKNPDLDEKFPQNIAAATILYYLQIHGTTVNKKQFSDIVMIGDVTITSTVKLVASIDNSQDE